jgi:hypothetical protein
MDNGFDVELVREFAERQAKDAGRIVALCSALSNAVNENEALKKKLAAASPAPDQGREKL